MVEYCPATELYVPTRRTRGAPALAPVGAMVSDRTGTIATASSAREMGRRYWFLGGIPSYPRADS
jgi:hypothetical protein